MSRVRKSSEFAAAIATALATALAAAGCGASNTAQTAKAAPSAAPAAAQASSTTAPAEHGHMRTLADVVGSESPSLLAIPGVTAVREGVDEDGNPAIIVVVDKLTADLRKRIPTRLQNVPVVIEPMTSSRGDTR